MRLPGDEQEYDTVKYNVYITFFDGFFFLLQVICNEIDELFLQLNYKVLTILNFNCQKNDVNQAKRHFAIDRPLPIVKQIPLSKLYTQQSSRDIYLH